jgi:mannose-6-phosphate isomerase
MARRLELYPYRFIPILKEKPWGGKRLRQLFAKHAPAGRRVGESWELADRGKDNTRVAEGPLRGITLRALIETWPREILGDEHALRYATRFPLLVKFLDCDQRISVQVHPSDEFANRHEAGEMGKMEAWVVVSVEPSARIFRGVLPGTTAADFSAAVQRGVVPACLNEMEVETGDVIFLPPGTIHAAGGGLVLAEVSQNSDVTYRIHDWCAAGAGRAKRPLHVDKAFAVSDFHSLGISKMQPVPLPGDGGRRRLLVKCEKFTLESIEIAGRRVRLRSASDRFAILVVLRGRGEIVYGKGGQRRAAFRAGQTFLLPAGLGDCELASRGQAMLLYIYI